MVEGRAVQSRDKVTQIYRNGIVVFVVIFSTISICLWFLSSLNF